MRNGFTRFNLQNYFGEGDIDFILQRDAAAVEIADRGDGQVTDIDAQTVGAFVADDIGAANQRRKRRIGWCRAGIGAAPFGWLVDGKGQVAACSSVLVYTVCGRS